MVETIQQTGSIIITLRPNRSASWLQTKLFLVAICFLVFTIAIGWSVVGAWVILPFAGFEAGLLAFIMYRVSYASYQKQIIHIDSEHVSVSKGVHKPIYSWRSKRLDTQLLVEQPDLPHLPLQLSLISQQQQLSIGPFLNQPDCQNARAALKQAGLLEVNKKWWQPT